MFLSNLLRSSAFVALTSAAMCLPACSSGKISTASNPLDSDVVRGGVTTDAALDEFLGSEVDDWAWAGGTFDNPHNQAVLSAVEPEAFTWHADSTTPPNPGGALSPTKQNGQTFLLLFSVPSNAKLLRVFTSLTAYTPDGAAWQKLLVAGGPIQLNIMTGTFENDLLTNDGGPHAGQTITFTIQ